MSKSCLIRVMHVLDLPIEQDQKIYREKVSGSYGKTH